MFNLALLKKILFWLLIIVAVCSLLLVAQIKVATYIYDSKLNSILDKFERRVPGLNLQYTPGENTFTSRQGRLFYNFPLKKNNNLGVDAISGAVDIRLLFGPLRLSGGLKSVSGEGNLESILAQYNVEPISFTGAFKATAVSPKIEGSLKTDSFLLPTSTGICKLGQNALSFKATSAEDVDIDLSLAGIVCEGALRYNDKPNYRLDLLGLDIKFLPRIIDKKPHFESLIINLKQLDFNFSTLYAIGFSPDDEVRDPSIQDAISFSNISTMITLSMPDNEGMSKLSFDNSGNYGFAFPYIRYNIVQPFYQLDNFKLSGTLDRISIPKLYTASKQILKGAGEQFEANKVFKEVLKGFTDTIFINIDNFGYSHKNQSFVIKGNTYLAFDEQSAKPKISRFDCEYHIQADKALVEDIAGEDYNKALNAAISSGQIIDKNGKYYSAVKLAGKQVTMNNIPLSDLVSQDDMLYEEEQKALLEQQAKQKADEAALKAEIEAAARAQDNLPSLVEGNLNSNSNEHAPSSD